jgi:hypothetical protein
VCPQHSCSMSLDWCLQFPGGSLIFGKIANTWLGKRWSWNFGKYPECRRQLSGSSFCPVIELHCTQFRPIAQFSVNLWNMITGKGDLNPNCLPCSLIRWPTASCTFCALSAVINHIHFQTSPHSSQKSTTQDFRLALQSRWELCFPGLLGSVWW